MSPTGIVKINLDAISANWCFLSAIASGAEVSAVIKANAYSIGAKIIAEELHSRGCRSFFVTTLQEANEIKFLLNKDSIVYVLGGVAAGDENIFVREKFVPVIYSIEMLHRWINYSAAHSVSSPVAIKVDTGMSRFGIQADEFSHELLNLDNKINLALFMSHLACADDRDHPLNAIQLERFKGLLENVKKFFPAAKASLANSSGVFLGSDWHFDLVRPGAALYGINPQPSTVNRLRSAVALNLPVLQIKKMESDVSVGYSATASVRRNARLAIVAGGYADGINRTLGSNPEGICCGQRVISVGRVSMDSTVFDVTHLCVSDEEIMASGIEVISESLSVDDLARKNNSLGYEVLTSMGNRYQRCYVRD